MKYRKIAIVIISFVFAIILISTGYGIWEQRLVIRGHLKINRPAYTEFPQESVTGTVYQEILPVQLDELEAKGVSVGEAVYQNTTPFIPINPD